MKERHIHKGQHIHMVGIGGIGMSALAQLYLVRGASVSGTDRGESRVTELLREQGALVHIGHGREYIPENCTALVYSDAIPEDNPERVWAREHGIPEHSYFEALGEATRAGTSIVVAGTHGKTTTTAMLAKILIDTGREPTVIAGSILSEQGSNFVPGRSDLYVIEGCEYKRHFLHLHPHVLVINNIELDHTDYYRDLPDMQDAFRSAVGLLPEDGILVTDTTSASIRPVLSRSLRTVVPYQEVEVPGLRTPGAFNVANARAAKAAALAYDPELDPQAVDEALAQFSGTWRRFEYKGVTKGGATVFDDYAHHPSAIHKTITMIREYSNKRLVIVFHPHLFSRTRDFMEEFADALAGADEVLLAPIYAAREEPIRGVSSDVLAEKVRQRGTEAHAYDSLESIRQHLETNAAGIGPQTLLVTMGAGDVYHIADEIVTCAEKGGSAS